MQQLELFPDDPGLAEPRLSAVECLRVIERALTALELLQVGWYLNRLRSEAHEENSR